MATSIDDKHKRLSAQPSQMIDREQPLSFKFNGRRIPAYAGDTIASALVASGVKTFSRSFKYHRRRGLLCGSGNCPNCLVQVGDEANVRSCITPVEEGMVVRSQNAWPSLNVDLMSLTQMVDRFLPVGFYYKAFMRPRSFWPLYEEVLRHAAGLGSVNLDSTPEYADKAYKHADVTVVGGGPAGMRAALAAAEQGAAVILMDMEPQLGGHLRYTPQQVDSQAAQDYAAALAASVAQHPRIEVLTHTTVFGVYQHLWIAAAQGNRLIKLRSKALVVAAGAYDIPALFENNDLPGIMLSSAAQRLIQLYGVRPGSKAVVLSAHAGGLQAALDLSRQGIDVAAVVEQRDSIESDLSAELQAANIPVMTDTTLVRANAEGGSLASVTLRQGNHEQTIACDLLVLATASMPALDIFIQAGGKTVWDDALGSFVPGTTPDGVFVAGAASGMQALADIEREGEWAGISAALAAGYGDDGAVETLAAQVNAARAEARPDATNPLPDDAGKHDFVCFCEDVTRKDIAHSIAEGYHSVELLKRYSTVSMGPCQGKMCNHTAMRLCALENAQTVAETGTTTTRPPLRSVPMGTLAGRMMEPVRVSSLHDWHVANGASMMNAGLWKRPEHYGDPLAEVRAVRDAVALIDISTLGKLHISGPDAAVLLDRLYINRWRKLAVGRVRYGVMLNQEGIIFDDGVTAHIDDDLYYMTATSGGATHVHEWIENWLQTDWSLDVHVLNATELRAAMNLTGPFARDVLAQVTEGVDLSNEAFPYMHAREGVVAGAPALLLRVGFTGELGYEIHVPSGYALQVWEALMQAGADYGIKPFGVEAQRVLRLEKGHYIVGQDTDGLTDPLMAGLGGMVKPDKDIFVGKTSLSYISEGETTQRLAGFEIPIGRMPEEGCQIVRPGDGPLGLEIIGRVTSVRYSPTLKKVIGLCWLPADMTEPGQHFTVRVRGELVHGHVSSLPFYDPDEARLRA